MAASEADVAAKLIERLLADPAFRARFRRDPAGACREAGLEGLAQEMSLGGGKAMHTLDMRESKSSLAGVMMAAAMEGVGIYELTENVLPHLEAVPGHIADVLSRVDLPAIPGLHHGGGGAAAAGVAEPPPHAGGGADAADAANGGDSSVPTPPAASVDQQADAAPAQPSGSSGSPAADSASTPGGNAAAKPGAPAHAPAKSAAATDAPAKSGAKAAVPPEEAAQKPSAAKKAAKRAAKKIAESLSPRAAHKQAASDAAAALDTQTKGLPESSDLPAAEPATDASAGSPAAPPELGGAPPPDAAAGGAPPADAAAVPGGGAATLPDSAPASLQATDASAPPEAVHHAAAAVAGAPHSAAAAHHAIDPSQFGQGGTGGHPDPEALALLHNKNVILDAHGIADIQGGRIDPRVVGVLTKLSQEHKITVSSISSDHPRFTTGGSVSNHYLGRGVDIAAIDGHIVDAGNPIAREVASELSSLEPGIRPNEIGSPWAISGPGYFTDAAHHNHLHIGFKQPIAPDWRPPADVAAPGDAATTAGAGAAKAVAAGATSAGGGATSATAGAAPPDVAAAPPEAAAGAAGAAAAQPDAAAGAPAAAAGAPAAAAAGGAPPSAAKGSMAFLQALDPKSRGPAHGQSQAFLKAVHPQQAAAQPPAGGAPTTAGATGATAEAAASSFTDTAYPGDGASQAQIAAWMAAEAHKRGLPAQLPVMASLVESGVKNLNFGDRDSVGFFQMRVGTWNSGAYAGFPDKPQLQIKWFLDQAEAVKAQRIARGQSVTDPHQYGDWIADIERPAEQYRGRYQLRLDEANGLLAQHAATPAAAGAAPAPGGAGATAGVAPTPGAAAAGVAPTPGAGAPAAGGVADAAGALTPASGGGGGLGAAALQVAETQKGVREIGSSNTGPQVDHYLQAAGVPPGNPWCASFVTWSLQHAGHKMPGGGWAAVSTWVRNAQAGTNGLKIVSADQAQPGDIVAYDWGGGTDFSSDGHIGFLASNVNNGQFNALEGNNADAVNLVPRHLGGGPNIVFIHVEGNTPTGAPATAPAAATTPAVAGAPAPPAPEPVKHDSMMFQALVKQDQPKGRRASAMFLKAIDPSQQVKPTADAAAAPAPPAPPASPPPAAAPPEVAPVPPTATPAADPATPAGSAAATPAPKVAAAAPDPHVAAASIDLTNAAGHYPGDDASQAELARWLAGQAQKAGLPPELPVMASLVESGVRNLNFGDRDSVGFFQMRVGIWNEGPYAGFPDHPALQAKWFIDNALAVKRRAIAAGDANFGKDPSKFGEWIADIERPAEQYRGRYQLRLGEARKLLGE